MAYLSIEGSAPTLPASVVPRMLSGMYDRAGFYPTTEPELSTAVELSERPGVSGCRDYLNEVFERATEAQTAGTEVVEPAKAVRNVVSFFAACAIKARRDHEALGVLKKDLAAQRYLRTDPLRSATLHTGIGQLVRYYDLGLVARSGTLASVPFYPLRGRDQVSDEPDASDPYTVPSPSDDVWRRIVVVGSLIQVGNASDKMPKLLDEQAARRDHWKQKLDEACLHSLAAKLAHGLLTQLRPRKGRPL